MGKKKYLLFVMSEENVQVIKNKGIIGFKRRFLKPLRNVSVGDEAVLYIKGRNLMGVFSINSKLFEKESEIFHGGIYPLRLKVKRKGRIVKKSFVDELISRLRFITNKKYWMGNFHGKSVIFLRKDDFKKLEDYLNEK